MITGIRSAQEARIVAASRSFPDRRGRGATLSRRDTMAQAAISATAIISPGTIPPMKSAVIDTLAATPKMMKAIEGGMTGAMMPPAAMRPAERGTL